MLHQTKPAGAAVISLFYEEVYTWCGNVAIHMAYGGVSHGKTNAIKIALAASANYPAGYTTYLSESTARHYLASAMPFGYDDPSSVDILRQLLINAFGGATMGHEHGMLRARCVPLITANQFIVDTLMEAEER